MARTLITIKADLVSKREELVPGLSTSQTADWFIWINIFAYAIYLFEVVMDAFKEDVETQLATKQPGGLEWYSERALAFQNNHTLTVDQWGNIGYDVTDVEAQIIKHASVVEKDGVVTVKVATVNEETNELEPLSLTTGEYLNFQRYMERIKFAGTAVEYRTLAADEVEYDVEVYYDPLYSPDELHTIIIEALANFRTNMGFDAYLYKSSLVNVIQSITGVITVKVNNLTLTATDSDPVEIDVVDELQSGYFNYSDNSTIQMININAQIN